VGAVAGGLAGEGGVAGKYPQSSCGRLQLGRGEAAVGDWSAFLFFSVLVCCCCGGGDTEVATTAAYLGAGVAGAAAAGSGLELIVCCPFTLSRG